MFCRGELFVFFFSFRYDRECFILSLQGFTVRAGLYYNANVNHYRRTHCPSTAARQEDTVTPDPGTSPLPPSLIHVLFVQTITMFVIFFLQIFRPVYKSKH